VKVKKGGIVLKLAAWLPNLVLFFFGIAGLGAFGYSFAQQTMIQKQMNQTMSIINDSIVSTGNVTNQTSQALQPLYDTTQSLAAIEQKEETTVSYIASMNNHLRNVGNSEQMIIQSLIQSNSLSTDLSNHLSALSQTNNQLLAAGQSSLVQASQEANQLLSLNQLTSNTINQMQILNEKLAPLRLLP
jgi:hypothetical protein